MNGCNFHGTGHSIEVTTQLSIAFDWLLSDAWHSKVEQVATFAQLLECIKEFEESVAWLLSLTQSEYVKIAPTAQLLPFGRTVVYRADEHRQAIEVCIPQWLWNIYK